MALTIERTIEILNRRRHRGSGEWRVVSNLRMVRLSPGFGVTSHEWLTEFEASAIAEAYLLAEQEKSNDSVNEFYVFLCRGGGVELVAGRPSRGDRGDMLPMIAGDEGAVAELREVARAQMAGGYWSDMRLCRFVNAGTVEVIGRDWELAE